VPSVHIGCLGGEGVSSPGTEFVLSLGALDQRVRERLRALDDAAFVRRLWERDATLWTSDPEQADQVRARLGWLALPDSAANEVAQVAALAGRVASEGYTDVVLLGIGGASLAPEVVRTTFGGGEGSLDLHVLDTICPDTVRAVERALDLAQTLFVVASESGTTAETVSLAAYFCDRVQRLEGRSCARRLVAVTTAGSPLAQKAEAESYRAVFVVPDDVGGRFAALSHLGLAAAGLAGIDVRELVRRGQRMAAACGAATAAAENEGVVLGAALAELALAGRDKVTLVCAPPLQAFGAWVEQLIAGSLGKDGKGILPVEGEPLGEPAVYGDDRAFLSIAIRGREPGYLRERLQKLEDAGHPVITLTLADAFDLGAEFVRWEIAVATAAAIIGVNPFDEPNVQESKENTRSVLRMYRRDGLLLREHESLNSSFYAGEARLTGALQELFAQARPGDFVALQAWLAQSPDTSRALEEVRLAIRDGLGLATTVGYGPRYLHSTGQYHKGGPNRGLFLQIVGEPKGDIVIPGEAYTFGTLLEAQSLGDLEALRAHGRRVVRISVGEEARGGLAHIRDAVQSALTALRGEAEDGQAASDKRAQS